jgi:tellurite resistance-related uncharacterized protein
MCSTECCTFYYLPKTAQSRHFGKIGFWPKLSLGQADMNFIASIRLRKFNNLIKMI